MVAGKKEREIRAVERRRIRRLVAPHLMRLNRYRVQGLLGTMVNTACVLIVLRRT